MSWSLLCFLTHILSSTSSLLLQEVDRVGPEKFNPDNTIEFCTEDITTIMIARRIF